MVSRRIEKTICVPEHFLFAGHTLNEFVRTCALPYLEDDSPEVRKGAALTCCRLFVRDPIIHQLSNHSVEIITDVVEKLLTVGIADPGESYMIMISACRWFNFT